MSLGQFKVVPGQINFMTLPQGQTAMPDLGPLLRAGLPIAPYIEHGSWTTGEPDIMRYGLDPYRGLGQPTTLRAPPVPTPEENAARAAAAAAADPLLFRATWLSSYTGLEGGIAWAFFRIPALLAGAGAAWYVRRRTKNPWAAAAAGATGALLTPLAVRAAVTAVRGR